MASKQRDRAGKTCKTWRARVKVLGVEHYLGAFATKEEAEAAEAEFRKEYHNEEYHKIRKYMVAYGSLGPK